MKEHLRAISDYLKFSDCLDPDVARTAGELNGILNSFNLVYSSTLSHTIVDGQPPPRTQVVNTHFQQGMESGFKMMSQYKFEDELHTLQ